MDYFEESIVAIPDELAVEFHNRAPPEVVNSILVFELTDESCYVTEELADMLGGLACLCCVFGEIF